MKWSSSRHCQFAGVVLAVVAIAVVAPAFLLGGAPVLALVLVLAAGWFPGENAIARLRDHRTRHARTRRPARACPAPRAVRRTSRLLICFSLANRPPPSPLHA